MSPIPTGELTPQKDTGEAPAPPRRRARKAAAAPAPAAPIPAPSAAEGAIDPAAVTFAPGAVAERHDEATTPSARVEPSASTDIAHLCAEYRRTTEAVNASTAPDDSPEDLAEKAAQDQAEDAVDAFVPRNVRECAVLADLCWWEAETPSGYLMDFDNTSADKWVRTILRALPGIADEHERFAALAANICDTAIRAAGECLSDENQRGLIDADDMENDEVRALCLQLVNGLLSTRQISPETIPADDFDKMGAMQFEPDPEAVATNPLSIANKLDEHRQDWRLALFVAGTLLAQDSTRATQLALAEPEAAFLANTLLTDSAKQVKLLLKLMEQGFARSTIAIARASKEAPDIMDAAAGKAGFGQEQAAA